MDFLLMSICGEIYIVPLYAIIQYRAHNRYVASIIAANNFLNSLFMLLGSGLVFVLYLLRYDVLDIILVLGILNIVAFVFIRKVVINGKNKG